MSAPGNGANVRARRNTMPAQAAKASHFHDLHRGDTPLVLVNIWDPGSAATVISQGAPALATGSASVASAMGFGDGEAVPLPLVLENARRIASSTDLPVTLDFEGGYATDTATLAENIRNVIATGVVGINFEDQVIGGSGLHAIDDHVARIAAIREIAEAEGVDLFINARTDVWLDAGKAVILPAERLREAITRGLAFAAAGANGFFVPGLTDAEQIAELCEAVPLPINAMHFEGMPSMADLALAGVRRISFGPGPYSCAMAALARQAQAAYH
ncbi:MAG: isocitrate lyase/PEP mutase family protein [Blastomonas fulva]